MMASLPHQAHYAASGEHTTINDFSLHLLDGTHIVEEAYAIRTEFLGLKSAISSSSNLRCDLPVDLIMPFYYSGLVGVS